MLVVDDQHSVCVALAYSLEASGYRVLTAESGPAAVGLAERETIDGALIDVHMPAVNGFDTCVRLRVQAKAAGRELRVWFMSGAFTRALERRSAELGACGVFAKPFNLPAFLARLEHDFSAPIPPLPPIPSSDSTGASVEAPP